MKKYMFGVGDSLIGTVGGNDQRHAMRQFCEIYGIDVNGYICNSIVCFNPDEAAIEEESAIGRITLRDVLEEYHRIVDKVDHIEDFSRRNITRTELANVFNIVTTVKQNLELFLNNLSTMDDILCNEESD